MFAQVSDDNDDTVRSWSLTLDDTTHIYIFPAMWSLNYRIFLELLRKFMDLLYKFFLFTVSAVCLSLWQRHGASWRWGWRNGLQTWRVAANVLNKQPWTEVKWLSRHSGPFGRGDRYRCDYNRLVQRFPFYSSWSAAYKTGGLGLGFEGNRLGKGILLGCTQSFTVGRQLFKEVTVISGVPQGSV
jgi:hypothetical protein